MAIEPDHASNDAERERRIEHIKARLREMSGGSMVSWESDALPLDEREAFWRRVLEFEVEEARRRRRGT